MSGFTAVLRRVVSVENRMLISACNLLLWAYAGVVSMSMPNYLDTGGQS